MQFFLTILQTHGDIGGPLGSPKKIEVIPEPLTLIEASDRAEHPVLAFKGDRRVLKRRSLLIRGIARRLLV